MLGACLSDTPKAVVLGRVPDISPRGPMSHKRLLKKTMKPRAQPKIGSLEPLPKGSNNPTILLLAPKYYICNGFETLYHHIWELPKNLGPYYRPKRIRAVIIRTRR